MLNSLANAARHMTCSGSHVGTHILNPKNDIFAVGSPGIPPFALKLLGDFASIHLPGKSKILRSQASLLRFSSLLAWARFLVPTMRPTECLASTLAAPVDPLERLARKASKSCDKFVLPEIGGDPRTSST